MINPIIKRKASALRKGERVICSDDDLDTLECDEGLVRLGLRSIANPRRTGYLDAYIVWAGVDRED